MDDVNTRQQFSFSSSEPRYSPLEFNSRKNLPTFDELKEKKCKGYGKTGHKNVQRVLQHCCKTGWKMMSRFLSPILNLSCNKSGCCKLLKNTDFWLDNITQESCLTRDLRCHLLWNTFGSLKHATWTDFVVKSRITLYSLSTFCSYYSLPAITIRGW